MLLPNSERRSVEGINKKLYGFMEHHLVAKPH